MVSHAESSWLCVVVLLSLPSSAAESESIILDDKENHGGASFFWPSAGEHSSQWIDSCFSGAHGDGFHHTGEQNKEQGSFTFNFAPSVTGCYRIEEHHLKVAEDACFKRLAKSLQLIVRLHGSQYSRLRIEQTHIINIDQREKLEAQWNALGQLMFHAGHPYAMSLVNANQGQCEARGLPDVTASGTCSWATTTAMDDQLECKDGTLCLGLSCCSARGGRAKCPPNKPIMCNAKRCGGYDHLAHGSRGGGGYDFCCESSCEGLGGARQCPEAACSTLKNVVGKCYDSENLPSPDSMSHYTFSAFSGSAGAYDFWDGTWAYVVADHKNGGTTCGQSEDGSSGGFYASTTKPTILVIGCSSLHADNTPIPAEGYSSLSWTDLGPTAWSHDGINLFKTLLPVGAHMICCKHSWALGAWIKESTEPEADQCLVLADALRLTRISNDCTFQKYNRSERHNLNVAQARRDALAVWTDGRIRLSLENIGEIRIGTENYWSSKMEGMQALLWDERAVVGAVLKDALRAEQVKVVDVKVGLAAFEVSFVVTGHQTTDMNKNDFARKLSDALRYVNVKVVAAEIAWQDEQLPPESEVSNLGFLVAIICGAVFVCSCAFYFVWRFECRKREQENCQDTYPSDSPNFGVVPPRRPSRHIDLESAGPDPRNEPSEEPTAQSSSAQHLPEIRPSAAAPARSYAEQWARERGDKLMTELRTLDQLPEEQRRTGLRALQRELHPDKIDPQLRGPQAQSLFEIVQAKWERLDNERRSRLAASTTASTTASQYGKPEQQPDLSNQRPPVIAI